MSAHSILRRYWPHRPDASRATAQRASPYAGLALAAALIVFAGFARTFYLRSITGSAPLSTFLVVHGIVMSSWFVLFLLQVALAGLGRMDWHRRAGAFGMLLAALVVCMGVAAAIDAGRRGASPSPDVPPVLFMAIPLFDMPVFGVLAGVAFWKRRRPGVHKRLMLLATLSMLTPAIGRLPVAFIQEGGPPVFFGIAIAIVLACVAVDTLRQRALHPAFAWGTALIMVMLPLRLLIGTTDTWARFAGWLISLS